MQSNSQTERHNVNFEELAAYRVVLLMMPLL